MDVDELIKNAWGAVDKAGVPEPIQGVALKEAIDFLRDGGAGGRGKAAKRARTKRSETRTSTLDNNVQEDADTPDPDAFFAQLADESGLDETALRDVLLLNGNMVHTSFPPRGNSEAPNPGRRPVVTALVAKCHTSTALVEIPSARKQSTTRRSGNDASILHTTPARFSASSKASAPGRTGRRSSRRIEVADRIQGGCRGGKRHRD